MEAKNYLTVVVVILNWVGCVAQPLTDYPTAFPTVFETDVPETSVPDVDGSSPLKWMGLAINFAVVAGLLLVSCYIARSSETRPGGLLSQSFAMLLPPHSKEEVRRIFSSDLRTMTPTVLENTILESGSVDQRYSLRHLPKAMLCWRRTQLTTAMLFYIAALVLSLINVYSSGSFSAVVAGDEDLSDTTILRKHFKEQMFEIIPFSQAVLSLSFYTFAAYRWHDLNQSRFLTVTGFCLTFLMPFAFFMVPWMEIDSPQRMVQDYCRSLASSGLPIIASVTGVELKDTDVCSKKAHEIGNAFANELKLNIENGSFALGLMGTVLRLLVYVPTLISSFIVMKSLAPGVLGILMGLQGGLRISKITFPGARLTTWLLVLLQAAALPVTMFLCAIILIVVGTFPTMFTAIFMTSSVSLYIMFHGRLLRANKLHDAISLVGKLNRAALLLKILAIVGLIFGVLKAAHILALKAEGIKVIENALKPRTVARMVISFMAGFFSSKVVFTDIVLHIIMGTYVACIKDPQEDRNDVMRDLLYLSAALKEYQGDFDLQAIEEGTYGNFEEMGQMTVAAPINQLIRHDVELTSFTKPNYRGEAIQSPMLQTQENGFKQSINSPYTEGGYV